MENRPGKYHLKDTAALAPYPRGNVRIRPVPHVAIERRALRLAFALVAAVLMLLPVRSYAAWPFAAEEDYLAKVGGKVITKDAFIAEINKLHTSDRVGESLSESRSFPKQDLSKFLGEIIDRKLMLIEAETLGLEKDPSFTSRYENYAINIFLGRLRDEAIMQRVEVSDGEIAERYREMMEKKLEEKRKAAEKEGKKDPEAAVEEEKIPEMTPGDHDTVRRIIFSEKARALEQGYFKELRDKADVVINEEPFKKLEAGEAVDRDQTIAVAQGSAIKAGDLMDEIERGGKHGAAMSKTEVLEGLIQSRLLDHEALNRHYENTLEIKGKLEKYRELLLVELFRRKEIVPLIKITDEDLQKYYDSHIEEYRKPDLVNAGYMLLRTETEASEVAEELRNKADFVYLATNKSIDPSKDKGGDLGWITVNMLPPDLRELVYTAKEGDIFGPFASRGAYAVIEFRGVKKGPLIPFDELKPQISNIIATEQYNARLKEYVERLKEVVPVKINKKLLREIEGG